MVEQGQQQGQGQGQGQGHSSDWRNLEQSRDSWKAKAESWQQVALKRTAQQQGFNPDQGVGKLLLDSFVRDQGDDLDPDSLDDAFTRYAQDLGVEPEGDGGQQGGQGSQGSSQPTEAESLLESRQATGQSLQQAAQPAQGEKALQDQIADAQQAGDLETAQQLSFQLATQQFVQSAQGTQQ